MMEQSPLSEAAPTAGHTRSVEGDRSAPRGVVPWSMEGVPGADTITALPTVDHYLEARLKQAALILWRHYQLMNLPAGYLLDDDVQGRVATQNAVTVLPVRAWLANEIEELRRVLDFMKEEERDAQDVGYDRDFLHVLTADPIQHLRVETLVTLNIPWTLGMGKRGRQPQTVEDAQEWTHPAHI